MSNFDLGPLPDPVTVPVFNLETANYCDELFYTADQMHAYAAAEVTKERERCAKICESVENGYWKDYKAGRYSTHTEGMSDGAGECAAAIRSQQT